MLSCSFSEHFLERRKWCATLTILVAQYRLCQTQSAHHRANRKRLLRLGKVRNSRLSRTLANADITGIDGFPKANATRMRVITIAAFMFVPAFESQCHCLILNYRRRLVSFLSLRDLRRFGRFGSGEIVQFTPMVLRTAFASSGLASF